MTTKTFQSNEVRINEGGMMRCCTETLAGLCDQWWENPRPIEVGTTVRCLDSPDDDEHVWVLDSTGTFRWDTTKFDGAFDATYRA